MSNKGTYNRKYYLHRQIKKAGFSIKREHHARTIHINPNLVPEAFSNMYLHELREKYSYGIQIINPLVNQL